MNETVVTFKADDTDEYRAVKEIVAKTHKEKPKPEDVARLKKMLAESPKLWRVAGNYSAHALSAVIASLPDTPFVVESIREGMERTKGDLGYEDSPPLERLMIDQIALCWLRLNMLERAHWNKLYESHSTEAGLYWDQRLSTAQRRFTRAVEALQKVRALTAATRLIESRTEAAREGRGVNNVRPLQALAS